MRCCRPIRSLFALCILVAADVLADDGRIEIRTPDVTLVLAEHLISTQPKGGLR
ncbi:MAG: hypothetical protein K8R59_10675 [Thermoanaerobaculales bacterium]|nr:hypothetical protein [Thermoanaerobaculales bacterium]